MTDAPTDHALHWHGTKAPSLDDFERLADAAFRTLPDTFRALCDGVIIRVEDFPTDDDCRPTISTLRGLGILRAKDMPPVEVILVEEPQPDAPYGIKGVGEIGLVPTAGAVAAALHALDGEWRSTLPMRRG